MPTTTAAYVFVLIGFERHGSQVLLDEVCVLTQSMDRLSESAAAAAQSAKALADSWDKAKLDLRTTAWERRNSNAPWYHRFEKRRRF